EPRDLEKFLQDILMESARKEFPFADLLRFRENDRYVWDRAVLFQIAIHAEPVPSNELCEPYFRDLKNADHSRISREFLFWRGQGRSLKEAAWNTVALSEFGRVNTVSGLPRRARDEFNALGFTTKPNNLNTYLGR